MEMIIELFNWFWALKMDVLIAPWVHANMIPLTMLGVVLRWWVKRTPSKDDDELIDSIMSVLPMIKRKP
jgi:hypothetical protein